MTLKKRLKKFMRKLTELFHLYDVLGFVGFCYVWLVGKTGRFDISGIKSFEKMLKEHHGGIFVTWHGRALMLPYFWTNVRQMKALVSPHRDGRIIARLLRCFKILSIDGSSDRQAKAAALDIVRELNCGTVVALISDGPRGPRMRLNKSVIYFAQKTGVPIMGLTYSATRSKVLNTWDALLIPPLFSKGAVLSTKPLVVPFDATEEQREILRQQFEDELNDLTMNADKKFGVPEIKPSEVKKMNDMEKFRGH